MKHLDKRINYQQMLKMYELDKSTREVDKVILPSILIGSFISSAKVLNSTYKNQSCLKNMGIFNKYLNSVKTTSNKQTEYVLDDLPLLLSCAHQFTLSIL